MKKVIAVAALVAWSLPARSADLPASLVSPDGQVVVKVTQGGDGQLNYSIERRGETIITASPLRIALKEGDLASVDVLETKTSTTNVVRKLVATKAAEARDHAAECRDLHLSSGVTD